MLKFTEVGCAMTQKTRSSLSRVSPGVARAVTWCTLYPSPVRGALDVIPEDLDSLIRPSAVRTHPGLETDPSCA